MLFGTIVGLSLPGAVNRHYYDRDKFNFSTYLSSIIIFICLNILLLSMINYFLGDSISYLTKIENFIFKFAIIGAGFSVIIDINSTLLRAERKPFEYGIFVVLFSLLLFLSILFIVINFPTIKGLVKIRVAILLLFSLIAIFHLKKRGFLDKFVFNKSLFYKASKFSIPTILHNFSAFFFIYSDRYIIQHYLGEESLGFYTGIFQLSSIISVIAISFNAAWIPFIFEKLKNNDSDDLSKIVKLSYWIVGAFLCIGVIYYILFPFISNIVLTPQFNQYNYLSIFFISSFIMQAIYFVFVPYIFYQEKTKYLGFISLISACFNVLLSMILIRNIGIIGPAVASLLAWFLQLVLTIIISNKLIKMPWVSLKKVS